MFVVIWQVFWLKAYFKAFPFNKIVAMFEVSLCPSFGGVGGGLLQLRG